MNPKPIFGYSDTETVMLDFDNTPFQQVKYWTSRTLRWFKLGGFVILKSSENNYHVLFNRTVSWEDNVAIMAWVCQQSKHKKLTGWFIFQCIKKKSTLRVSSKRQKPSPRIVYRFGKQDKEIRNFLHYRRLVKDMMRRIRLASN